MSTLNLGRHRAPGLAVTGPSTYIPRHSSAAVPRHRGVPRETYADFLAWHEADKFGVDLTRRGWGRHVKERS